MFIAFVSILPFHSSPRYKKWHHQGRFILKSIILHHKAQRFLISQWRHVWCISFNQVGFQGLGCKIPTSTSGFRICSHIFLESNGQQKIVQSYICCQSWLPIFWLFITPFNLFHLFWLELNETILRKSIISLPTHLITKTK